MSALSFSLAVVSSAMLLTAGAVHAQPVAGGNADGAQIASQGVGGNVPACVSCHGAKGEGNPAGNFPRLAGLPKAYFINQITAYQDGRRVNPVMMPIAKGLSRQQIEAVAGYYAELSAPAAKPAGATAAQASRRAQQLANVGDEKLGVQACANCHGPGGSGEPPTYPYLAGQHAGYLTAALNEWKNGNRKTDPSMQMNIIAKRLGDSDINELSAYFAAQTPPGPESSRAVMPAGTAARPVPQPQGGGAPAGGGQPRAGVEQGQPTTGGSQGPGGGGGTGTNAPGKPKGTP
ncbi:cytochrome c553 [Paucimonas lemoignei]|uniref:Cytochrome c553 n=1 Tax=Paucimonas lemoignei TaxID=29443 RepID=A0A4R3HT10_PAULE|nr:c-type cytochrome [Paucimonas lemoignei]TCS36277.1 cytochrome c553 [Paucimonas lemoignei]